MIEFITAARDLETARINYDAAFPDREPYARFMELRVVSLNKTIRLYKLAMSEHDEIKRYYILIWDKNNCVIYTKLDAAIEHADELIELLKEKNMTTPDRTIAESIAV